MANYQTKKADLYYFTNLIGEVQKPVLGLILRSLLVVVWFYQKIYNFLSLLDLTVVCTSTFFYLYAHLQLPIGYLANVIRVMEMSEFITQLCLKTVSLQSSVVVTSVLG